MAERSCVTCAGPLAGRQTKHCSSLCANRALHRARTADGRKAEQRRLRGKARRTADNRRSLDRQRAADPTGFVARQRAYEADRRRREGRPPLAVSRGRVRLRKAARGTRGGTWAQGPCQRCGVPFVGKAQFNGIIPAYCSKVCAGRDKAERRELLKRNAYVARVSRFAIFERDHWRCKLCGKAVKRNAVVPHPKAPVLDHILPLNAEGTHEPRNVQCAHFLCNSIKRDQAANDQLRLIG